MPLLLLILPTVVTGAELGGIAIPDTRDVAGNHLVLNGMALRTYSFLRVHIYVAGLYLENRSSNPDDILNSKRPRLLQFVFTHEVGAEAGRKSWQESIDSSCTAPCHLPPASVSRFLAAIPAVRSGDTSSLLFSNDQLDVSLNGKLLGRIDDATFARVILSSFIGPHPTTQDVKRGLLGAKG